MGGLGSGRWYRWQGRTMTLEEVPRLDVRWLCRQGYVQSGACGVLTWHGGERPLGVVGVTVEDDRMGVAARVRVGGEDWAAVRQVLPLAWTPCHYGGQRPWFRCGGYHRRVAVLCLDGTGFLCRHCTARPYGSQQETAHERHYRKVRKIRTRLGVSGNVTEPVRPWTKPKGMHWRTWKRLRQQEAQAQWQMLCAMEAELGRWGR